MEKAIAGRKPIGFVRFSRGDKLLIENRIQLRAHLLHCVIALKVYPIDILKFL